MKRKFTAGDLVRCTRDCAGFTNGKLYVVLDSQTVLDDDGDLRPAHRSHLVAEGAMKAGDEVRYTEAVPDRWFFGPHTGIKTDTIRSVSEGRYQMSAGGSVAAEHIEPVDRFAGWDAAPGTPANDNTPEAGCFIIRIAGSRDPVKEPRIPDTRASAEAEAERLALGNPGVTFEVFERVTYRVADVVLRKVA